MSVSKQQHDKQATKARRRRRASTFDKRSTRNRAIIISMAVLMGLSLVAVPLTTFLSGEGDPAPASDDAPDDAAPEAEGEPPTTVGPCGETPDDVPEITSEIYDEPFDMTIDPDATYSATVDTTCGEFVIELDAENAPLAVNNLVNLADNGYYEGVPFHRVVPDFVVQVGDPAGTGCGLEDCTDPDTDEQGFPGYTFDDELETAEILYEQVRVESVEEMRAAIEGTGEEIDEETEELLTQLPGGYPRGTVAMANAGPDTNGSQFFVAQGDPTLLPGPSFTVFGTVVEGMDVVDDIAASPTGEQSRPFEEVLVRGITIQQG